MIAVIDLAALWQGFLTNLPGIITVLLALLPSLINGLTDYPNLATGLGKFQSILGLLSVVVHKDSPGTFKIPLTHSEPPQVIGSSIGPVAIKGPANTGAVDRQLLAMGATWLLIMAGAVALLGNCAVFQKLPADVVECTKEEKNQIVKDAVPEITAILLAGVAGWQAELASWVSKIGEDEVGCIVEKLASGWTPPSGTAAAMPPAGVRAYQWLNTQPKTFKL